ncbi:MAG TPA: CPBP family intramembrane glutamic endopeptidase [Thermoanaerobaculia bacterium]|nr:CPBP family intramembrane glutamic endopeptidase [Thermoanaerobaculia bacterium]
MEAVPRVALTRRDWIFIAVCLAVIAVSAAVIGNWFSAAFPEASIDFRYDRATSKPVAAAIASSQQFDLHGMKHAVTFDSDDTARIFLERSLGLKRANEVMKRDVRLWYWHHRWFRPLQEDELDVDVAPTGEIVSMARKIPESRPMPTVDAAQARKIAETFLARIGANNLDLVSQSERKLPGRVQRIFTWSSRDVHPAAAEYRHTITVDGNSVSSYGQHLKVPEDWLRSYRELRSKNNAAGNVDLIFMIATMIAALAVFVGRLRRGDLRLRFLLGIGAVAFVLSVGVSLNSWPSAIARYDTTTSYPAFVGQMVFFTALQSIGTAMLLIVICGAGEVLFRERFPEHLAMSRVFVPRALTSKRVFRSLILGYTLVAFFIAYQTIFYVVAEKFGAWAPADVPYDDILNSAIPWVAVLFAGFFPALSEEFLSRAFSIPFFERIFRSRLFAIILAGYIWGFGHSTYPNQPFYIRGLEVGSAGVLLGFLLQSFGLLPLLIWHYTVDAVYTALLLFRSGHAYYVLSGALSSLVFLIPLIASIALYIRNRGFVPDEDSSNAALPVTVPAPVAVERAETPLPAPIRPGPRLVIACVVFVAIAAIVVATRPASPDDVIDYQIGDDQAKSIAAAHLRSLAQPLPQKMAALPVSAFRSWDADSPREEGGSPDGFDETAATYMVRHGMRVPALVGIMRTKIPTATWMVRFFTPLQKTEYFVEVDPRTSRVVGYHKYTDERSPGARLERDAAMAIATQAFTRYGASAADFDLKDALSFQQPNRRDWLFHFEEKRPLVAEAFRRVSVRVMGAEVTQFAATVKVPESVYREARRQTILNILLLILRALGAIAVLALVVSGFIMATRHGRMLWRRAARVTLILAIIPIARALTTREMRLFIYNTTMSWDTFLLSVTTDAIRTAGLQILMLFVAVAAIFAVVPYAPAVLSREGRSRFGRHAVIAVLTTIGLLISGRAVLRLIAHAFPAIASVGEISVPDSVVLRFPALIEIAIAVIGSIVFAGGAALFATAVAAWKNRSAAAMATMAIVFCLALDSSATMQELPMTIGTSLALAVLAWVIARWILDSNPAAWPLAAFVVSLIESAASMGQNHRSDLQIQAWIVFAVAAATLIWAAWDYTSTPERFSTTNAPGD